MDHATDRLHAVIAQTPRVRRVDRWAPLSWLRRGWDDLLGAGSPSLGYGILVAAFAVLLLLAFAGVGAVFAFGVVTAPLLLDRPVDVVTAALTSVRCCAAHPGAALLWAALIAVLTGLGFVTAMIGLVVVFAWLGHASWHACRDLVEPP